MQQLEQLDVLLSKEGVEQWYQNDVEIAGELVDSFSASIWQEVVRLVPKKSAIWQERLLYICSEEHTGRHGLPIVLNLLFSDIPDVAQAAVDALIDHPSYIPSEQVLNRVQMIAKGDDSWQWALEHLTMRIHPPRSKE